MPLLSRLSATLLLVSSAAFAQEGAVRLKRKRLSGMQLVL